MAHRRNQGITTSVGLAPVEATVHNERSIHGKGTYKVRFDLAHDIEFKFDGPAGPHPASIAASDLLDIALSVSFVERDLRKLALTNRVNEIELKVPVRQDEKWDARRETLEKLLRFMGGYGWKISFVKSHLDVRKANSQTKRTKKVIVLHSGGMDSTCGIGTMGDEPADVQLVSFHTSQRPIQESIAEQLGFDPPSLLRARWKRKKTRRGRSAFAYRSFLFLSLAALIAETFKARSIFQFENGFMAASVPACSNYFVTRHAHPKYHRLFNELLQQIGVRVVVTNPLRWKTKREAVMDLFKHKGRKKANELLKITQSCWFYSYHQFPSRFRRERVGKTPHEHCGLCVPCLIRRTAFRDDAAYSLDPRNPPASLSDERNATYNYDAYASFCDLVLRNKRTAERLRRALLENGIILDSEVGSWKDLHRLIVQFAKDFNAAFQR